MSMCTRMLTCIICACSLDKPGTASISTVSPAIVGQSVRLECQVDDKGSPDPVYKWWRSDNPGTILQSTDSPVYVISTARLQDNGNFTCLPSNMMGTGIPATVKVQVFCECFSTCSPPLCRIVKFKEI